MKILPAAAVVAGIGAGTVVLVEIDPREGTPLFSANDASAELVVRIHDREGKGQSQIPPSMRVP